MKLLDYISREHIAYGFSASSKDGFFQAAIDRICVDNPGFSPDSLHELFLRREQTMSTGIGLGLAIPHIVSEDCQRQVIYVFRLQDPLDFDSLDKKPVHLVFMLIASAQQPPGLHLQTLAHLGLLLKRSGCLEGLLAAATAEELYGVLQRYD